VTMHSFAAMAFDARPRWRGPNDNRCAARANAYRRVRTCPATPCAPDQLPIPLSCSRWWIRNLRRRSSCRWDASWCRRSGRAARRRWYQ
jgi:hypothetical protein